MSREKKCHKIAEMIRLVILERRGCRRLRRFFCAPRTPLQEDLPQRNPQRVTCDIAGWDGQISASPTSCSEGALSPIGQPPAPDHRPGRQLYRQLHELWQLEIANDILAASSKKSGAIRSCVGTKFHIRGEPDEKSIIDSVNGRRRLGIETIDVLLIHGAENAGHLTDERVVGAFEKLYKEGKYKYRGLSCHSNHFPVIKKAVDSGHYDMVQLGYNVFD